ncbi:MAG: UDP-2,4-diacetamido-2,4,6-trideoxy-beta-L-altropyranose hydrolase, partial [Candidatus Omnitrophica bacterium]|nr:UDP-2,4-diacetamido-2,4,6-trideoxy-beta-L-altropyranose hydrolase [Candidatus Omnitrophota bacterium]
KDNNTDLIYNPDANKMKKVMSESDIAISAGGQTLYELARIGVPAIGVCVADNQILNLKKWAETGFLRFAGRYDDSNLLSKIDYYLSKFRNRNARYVSSKDGRSRVDGKGADRIVRQIFQEKS